MAENNNSSPLNQQDVEKIKSIWSAVMKDPNTHGINFFIKFFRDNPTFIERFSSLRDLKTEDELRSSKRLKSHASQVLYAITALVDNLEDLECVGDMINKITLNHLRRSINWPFFESLAKCMVSFLAETLGSTIMDSKATDAWTKVFAVITETVKTIEQQQQLEENNQSITTTTTSTSTPQPTTTTTTPSSSSSTS